MTYRFDLASFEFHANHLVPEQHRPRRFIVVGQNLGLGCELLLCQGQVLAILAQSDLVLRHISPESEHYMGLLNGEDLWVLVVSASAQLEGYQWQGLRSQLDVISADFFQLAGRALQIAQWFYDHRFCGRCGRTTEQDELDRAKLCRHCNLRFYPRISPCMIVLVTRGDEVLLAHHQRANRKVYSTLAGFVEAGESVEDCVRREVMEEVGVSVGQLDYFRSQPWPFPSQLMLGFFAEYSSGDIQVDGTEILDAQWFRYDQLPDTPGPQSVAGQLIGSYIQQRRQLALTESPL